jgi:hypothetical protein
MKRSIVLLPFLLAAAAVHAEEAAKPAPYTSAVLGFTATYPGPPRENTNVDGGGTAAFVDQKGYMYMVGVIPARAENAGKPAKQQLDEGVAGALAKVKGEVVSQKDIKLGKHPGREVEIKVNDGKATMRAYLVDGGKAYLQVVVQKNGVELPMPMADFFASFKLSPKKP